MPTVLIAIRILAFLRVSASPREKAVSLCSSVFSVVRTPSPFSVSLHERSPRLPLPILLLFALLTCIASGPPAKAAIGAVESNVRTQLLLSDAKWQFFGSVTTLPDITTDEFNKAPWTTVQVPHVFQTRANPRGIVQGWYRREIAWSPDWAGKQLYLVFEGAAAIADVYVNGIHLGQHRGAYTRFVFDATDALKPGTVNTLAVKVDNARASTVDCLPSHDRLYKVWGGLYRKVWLMATDSLHVDPTDFASPGLYLTPTNVSAASADLSIKALIRNSAAKPQDADVRASLIDPAGVTISTLSTHTTVPPGDRSVVELKTQVKTPEFWAPGSPNLYHVRVDILRGGQVVDSVTEPTGFRTLEWTHGTVNLNGKPIVLIGVNLHQEIESKASAISDDDFRANFAAMQDLGINWLRLPHYPHARIEYDLCDQLGILCWAENGHSNSDDIAGPTGDQITTELVKQNYNHPSIALWSMGNESSAEPAERFDPIARALDPNRIVVVANMKSNTADFRSANSYPGWYGGGLEAYVPTRYISEIGAGGVVTIHCDYAAAKKTVDKYEPEEYQQLVAEHDFQALFHDSTGRLGMFTWWTMRDFNDVKYKKPIGWNTKGLLTYAGDKKDVYYLYRSFLRPQEPTVHITSKRYFLRAGDPANGIKVYSNAARLTLTLNGEKVSTLENGKYTQPLGKQIDNVFYWPVVLHTGKNDVVVDDGDGHFDSTTVYFYGQGGAPEIPVKNPLIKDLATTNPDNHAYYMDMPVQDQWPIYYDLDSTADNSFAELPAALSGATWIALRRVTKEGQETDLSFTLNRPATVYLMCTKTTDSPTFASQAGFTDSGIAGLVWRDNKLLLNPAQILQHHGAAGETIHISKLDRDLIVLLKE